MRDELIRCLREATVERILRQDLRKTVLRVERPGDEPDWFVKAWNHEVPAERLKVALGRFGAPREERTARRLRARGIATPETVGVACERDALALPLRSIRATRWAEGFVSLRDLAVDGGDAGRLAEAARAVGAFLARAHDAGVYPRDVNFGNLMIQSPADGPPAVLLVDLERVWFRKVRREARVDNLSQLAACLAPALDDAAARLCAGYAGDRAGDWLADVERAAAARRRRWAERRDARFEAIADALRPHEERR